MQENLIKVNPIGKGFLFSVSQAESEDFKSASDKLDFFHKKVTGL